MNMTSVYAGNTSGCGKERDTAMTRPPLLRTVWGRWMLSPKVVGNPSEHRGGKPFAGAWYVVQQERSDGHMGNGAV